MKNLFVLLISMIMLGNITQAQLSPYHPHYQLYKDGVELYEKGVYGPALKKMDAFLAAERNARTNQGNDLRINARYIQAISTYHLGRSNAIKLMEKFIIRYDDNTKATLVRYYLGKHYFEDEEYAAAIEPLLACYTRASLDKERADEVVFMLGYAYFEQDQDDRAVRFFELAAGNENKYQEDAQYYHGILLYEDGRYDQAHQALSALEKSPKYGAEVQVYLANTLYQLQKYDELFTLSDRMLRNRRQKTEPQVYLIVANASYEKNDYPKALQYFGEYDKAKAPPLSRTSNFRYAFSHYKGNKYQEAIPYFQKVLSIQEAAGGGKDSLQQMASYYLGFCYLEIDDPNSARFAFQKAKEPVGSSNPKVTEDALYHYAKVCYTTQDYEPALKAFRQLESDYPGAPYASEVKSVIGELLLLSKDYEESIAYLETTDLNNTRAKKAYQTSSYYYALELFQKEDYAKAIVFLRKAASNGFDPDMTLAAKYWIAEAEFRQNEFTRAATAYNAYLNSPNARSHTYYAAASYGLGWSYFKQKKYTTAINHFDKFISQPQGIPKQYLVDAYLRTGDSYFLLRNYGKANTYYTRVAEDARLPGRDYAFYQMGEGLYRQGQYRRSIQTFDKIVTGLPKSELRDNALDRISELYATWLKDYSRAADYARLLVNEYPRSPLAADGYNRLAFVSYSSGDEASAVQYFKKVLSDYSSDKKNSQIALDNLSNLIPGNEFDRILKDYRSKNPEMDENLAQLSFTTGQNRFFEGNYESAISQFSNYINDFKNGPNYFEALIFRARSYKAINKLRNALEDYQLVYSPKVRNPFTSTALMEAAEIKHEQLDYGASLKLYQELRNVAGTEQNRIQADFGIAKNYKAMGEYSQAINVLSGIIRNPEAVMYTVNEAKVEQGECQYYNGNLDEALRIFSAVEAENKDEFGERSQYWITQIQYDMNKLEAAKDAAQYLKLTYPSNSYWRAKAFLVVADADYKLGNAFQAKGVLESLIAEAPFEDIKAMAQERLDRIIAEESQIDGINNN